MKYILLIVGVVSLSLFSLDAQVSEKLFTIPWGDGQSEIGLKVYNLGGPSHEQGYFTLRYGPEAIAVIPDKEIFIMDKVHNRVLGFDFKGKLVDTYNAPTALTGLAVSQTGTLVAFSPFEKYAVGITGSLAGDRIDAPPYFSSLSEVWFVGEELWGRYMWNSARLDKPELSDIKPYSRGLCIGNNEIAVGIFKNDGKNSFASFSVNGTLCNAYASGQVLSGDKIAVTLVRPGENMKERSIEVMLCDIEGNSSVPMALSRPWTECFCHYTLTQDGTLYEMVTHSNGVTIRRWKDAKLEKKIKVTPDVPAEMVIPKIENGGSASRRTITVWFRNTGEVKSVDLEEYLKGVVSQEIYSSWTLEAHKSMALGARTYAVARYRHPEKSPKAHVCTSTCCQAWTSNYTSNAIQGVNATAGKYIVKGGTPVTEPLYFSHCNGHTRNSEDYDSWSYIAYLRSVSCSCGWTSYYGHGVGMCQYGMEAYAKSGWNYVQIIEHYYTGCTVGNQ